MRVAIIPARGGSKRIHRKNIRLFNGKPILTYPIEAALKSNLFDRVIVSTDDEEIADIAIKYGAEVPFLRTLKNSDDEASLHDVVLEVLNKIKENINEVALILPTAAFINIDLLQKLFDTLVEDNIDSALTVVKYEQSIDKALYLDEKKNIKKLFPEKIKCKSQSQKEAFHDAGQIYVFSTKGIEDRVTLTSSKCRGLVVSKLECQDIDTEEDWLLAELKFKMWQKLI